MKVATREGGRRDDYETPGWFYERAIGRVGWWDSDVLDVAAVAATSKGTSYLGPDHPDPDRRDGLAAPWLCERVWMNPPYGVVATRKWAHAAKRRAKESGVSTLALMPGHGWGQVWMHEHVFGAAWAIWPIAGRIPFLLDGVAQTSPASANILILWAPGWPPAMPRLMEPIDGSPPR